MVFVSVSVSDAITNTLVVGWALGGTRSGPTSDVQGFPCLVLSYYHYFVLFYFILTFVFRIFTDYNL